MAKHISFGSPEVLYRIYYECFEVGNKEMREIFGGEASNNLIWKIKREVKEKMAEQSVRPVFPNNVSTKVLYEYLGLNIEDIERRVKKLQKLNAC